MRIIRGVEKAKSTILKRSPWGAAEIPETIRQRIKGVFGEELTPQQVVERIIARVRSGGDAALREYTWKLDGVQLDTLTVTLDEIEAAYRQVDRELVEALSLAAERVRSFYQAHRRRSELSFEEGGLGQLILPLEKVGIYIPGGTASYPSTVLMTAILARVAGVKEIILTTPPQQEGKISPATLVAAHLARVDSIFKVGGAQAIAALAFGTETVPKVDKICGPGNIFVQLAKKSVYGSVNIDGLYGPTETVVVADETADPAWCAADLLAQAEHDSLASALLITTSEALARKIKREVRRQMALLERGQIAAVSLERQGGIILVPTLKEAIELVNYYAPEHVSLMVQDAWSYLGGIRNAGGIFVGESSPEALGDYIAGPSHVMPTGGTARFSSVLSVDDFTKVTSVVALDKKALCKLGPAVVTMARTEGLTGHSKAIEIRQESMVRDSDQIQRGIRVRRGKL